MITKKSGWYSLKSHGASFQGTPGRRLFIQLPEELLSLTLVLLEVPARLKEDSFIQFPTHKTP